MLEITEYDFKDKYLLMDTFDDPNYTQVPNQLLGSWERNPASGESTFIPGMLSDMSEAELKVCLALCRLTYGFHRERAPAPLSFLQDMTGMSRQGVLNGLERLVERGLFFRFGRDGRTTVWARGEANSQRSRPIMVNEVDRYSQRSRHNKESIKKERKNALSSAKSTEEPAQDLPADPVPEDYTVHYYYRNKEFVRAVGTVTKGPWVVNCPNCENDVTIGALEEATECLCGMHEFVLMKHRPKAVLPEENEAVAAYFLITGRKRGTIAQVWLDEIVAKVTDVPFWRQVVKEYCGQGWNRGSVDKMLKYYEEGRLPGTRKKKEDDQGEPKVTYEEGRRQLHYDDGPKKGAPRVEMVDGRRQLHYDG